MHTGLILEILEDDAWVLFLTSNDTWSKKVRKLSNEELSLFGFPKKEKFTYFAPVVRPAHDATADGRTFPEYRIRALEQEFGPSPLVKIEAQIYEKIRPRMPKKTLYDILKEEIGEQELRKNEKLMAFATGKLLPRNEIFSAIRALPKLRDEFFFRRESKTLGIQLQWSKSGQVLKKQRLSECRSLEGLGQVAKLNPADLSAFEEGIQCPSYQDMLKICNVMPQVPPDFTIPTSVPFFGEVLAIELGRMNKKNPGIFGVWTARTRIRDSRFIDIMAGKRPNANEIKRISALIPGLPPYRDRNDEFDWIKS